METKTHKPTFTPKCKISKIFALPISFLSEVLGELRLENRRDVTAKRERG